MHDDKGGRRTPGSQDSDSESDATAAHPKRTGREDGQHSDREKENDHKKDKEKRRDREKKSDREEEKEKHCDRGKSDREKMSNRDHEKDRKKREKDEEKKRDREKEKKSGREKDNEKQRERSASDRNHENEKDREKTENDEKKRGRSHSPPHKRGRAMQVESPSRRSQGSKGTSRMPAATPAPLAAVTMDANRPDIHVHIQFPAPNPLPKARLRGSIGRNRANPPAAATEDTIKLKARADADESTKQEGRGGGDKAWWRRAAAPPPRCGGDKAWRAAPPRNYSGRGGGNKAWWRTTPPPQGSDRWKVMSPRQDIGGATGSDDTFFVPAVLKHPLPPRPPPPALPFHYIPPWATWCSVCGKKTYIGQSWCMTPTCNMKKY